MINRDALEKALLLGIVKEQNWEILVLNAINEEYFTSANKPIYEYIHKYIVEKKYPELPILAYEFKIEDSQISELTEISDLQGLCDALKNDYLKQNVVSKVSELNNYNEELETNPRDYINRIGNVYNDLKLIGYSNKSIDLFESIDDILTIDPNDVITTGFKELDEQLVGWKRGEELVVITARTNQGKEQPLSAKILTPDGWKLMKDIKIGDTIFSGTGELTKVIGVYPQGKKDVYRISFTDGTSAECGLEHLWKVKEKKLFSKKRTTKVITLKEMIKKLDKYKNNQSKYTNLYAINYIPLNIDFKTDETVKNINPYLEGLKLGRNNHSNSIPKSYLYSTFQNRVSLLQGIVDARGQAKEGNYQDFYTLSKSFALDFIELIKSLAGNAHMIPQPIYFYNTGVMIKRKYDYKISYSLDFNPYTDNSKANKWKPSKEKRMKYIRNIKKVRQEECQCIMVDNEDHTYITDDYTITHNTWLGLKFALAAALKGERVGIYSGEMSKKQLQDRMLCCAKRQYTDSKEDALKFIKSENPFIRLITQKELRRRANVDDIEEMIIRDKLTCLVVDQLSLMEDNTCKPGTPLRQQYSNISNDLFSLGCRYGLPIILLTQSNRNATQEKGAPTLENIAESDAVGQNATRVISMRNENGVMTLLIAKNRYGPVGGTIKYEIDFSINKFKPIREAYQEEVTLKRAKARQIFGSGGATF